MILDIKYFGKISELAKQDSEQVEMEDEMNVSEFKLWLLSRYPNLKSETFQIAVNKELKLDDFRIEQTCEIAILPPFAGG